MSDQAAAAEKYVEQYEATMTLGWGDDTAYAFAKAVVALSARLAQECALRAQAEQERDVEIERRVALAREIDDVVARLREYEKDAELALTGLPDPMHPSLPREWEDGLVCAQVLISHLAGYDDPGNVKSARAALAGDTDG